MAVGLEFINKVGAYVNKDDVIVTYILLVKMSNNHKNFTRSD